MANGDVAVMWKHQKHTNLVAMLCRGVGHLDAENNRWIVYQYFSDTLLISLERYRQKGYTITVY